METNNKMIIFESLEGCAKSVLTGNGQKRHSKNLKIIELPKRCVKKSVKNTWPMEASSKIKSIELHERHAKTMLGDFGSCRHV